MVIDYKCDKGHFKTVSCETCLIEKREEMIRARVRNQLRIHWGWLRDIEDYNEAADFVDNCIKQVNQINSKGIGTAQA